MVLNGAVVVLVKSLHACVDLRGIWGRARRRHPRDAIPDLGSNDALVGTQGLALKPPGEIAGDWRQVVRQFGGRRIGAQQALVASVVMARERTGHGLVAERRPVRAEKPDFVL